MALNSTTLSTAVLVSDTVINLTSTTGVSTPTPPVGPVTYMVVEGEVMVVTAFNGTSGAPVGVARGQNGTRAVAHNSSAPVLIFNAGDFGSLYFFGVDQLALKSSLSLSVGAPVASANTITPTIWGPDTCFHVTGTTVIKTITAPTGFLQGECTIIFDAAGTWDATGNIAVASSTTQTTTYVTFLYDAKAAKWYPSKI